jgi:hypothetical protein
MITIHSHVSSTFVVASVVNKEEWSSQPPQWVRFFRACRRLPRHRTAHTESLTEAVRRLISFLYECNLFVLVFGDGDVSKGISKRSRFGPGLSGPREASCKMRSRDDECIRGLLYSLYASGTVARSSRLSLPVKSFRNFRSQAAGLQKSTKWPQSCS